MTTMQCPLGHPPGPQAFCPICGRATVPVAEPTPPAAPVEETVEPTSSWPAAPERSIEVDEEFAAAAGAPPRPESPPPPPPAPAPDAPAGPTPIAPGPSWSDFAERAEGPAAAETRRLIDELQAGRPVTPPEFPAQPSSWAPPPESRAGGEGGVSAGEPAGGVFPTEDVPDYAPTPPTPDHPGLTGQEPPPAEPAVPVEPALGVPVPGVPVPGVPVPGVPVPDPTAPAVPPPPSYDLPPRGSVLDTFADTDTDAGPGAPERAGRRRSPLLPLLLILVVLAGAAYLFTRGGGDDTGNGSAGPAPVRPSATGQAGRASALPRYTAAQIADSRKDAHFNHGYLAGVRRAKAGPVSDPEATCRAMGLRQRKDNYPWGAHDQQGCIVGITQGV